MSKLFMSFSAYNTHSLHKHTISRKQTCGVVGQQERDSLVCK